MLEPKADLGMTRSFRRKLVLAGSAAWLVTLAGLFSPNEFSVLLLVPASAGCICWLFLLSYALYDAGLFKRYPDERQRELRNRVCSVSYRLVGVLIFAALIFGLFNPNHFDPNALIRENVALFTAGLLEFLFVLPVALVAWLEPDPFEMEVDA